MSDIWLIHVLRRTRRDSNGGFITEFAKGVSVDRYTTQPITVNNGTCGKYMLEVEVKG
jgi:hypothetical protein